MHPRVHPFRGESAPMPDADEGALRVERWRRSKLFKNLEAWERGVGHASPPYDAMMQSAIDTLASCGPASDPHVEAVMLHMLDYSTRRGMMDEQGGDNDRYYPVDAWFIRRWRAAGGNAFALRVLAAFPALGIEQLPAARTHSPPTIKESELYDWRSVREGHLGIFHVLRRAIATSDDYNTALTEAVRIRDANPPMLFLRAAIAFAFPDEPFWQDDLRDAQAKVKPKKPLPSQAWGLVTTRIDQAAIPAILSSMAKEDEKPFATDTAGYGFTLVHRFGDGAAQYLIDYLKTMKEMYAKESFAGALALTKAPEARAFFETKLKDRDIGKIAKAYLAG